MSDEQTEPQKPAEKAELSQLSAKVPKAVYDKIIAAAQARGLFNSDIVKEAMERFFAPDPADDLRTQLKNLQTYSESQADDMAELERKITRLEAELEEKEADLEKWQTENERLVKRATELETAGQQAKGSADTISTELTIAKAQLATATKERDELKSKLKEALSTADIKLMTANQSRTNQQAEINAIGDLAIQSGLISPSTVSKVSPSYVPRKHRK